jgi:hypothetical protein
VTTNVAEQGGQPRVVAGGVDLADEQSLQQVPLKKAEQRGADELGVGIGGGQSLTDNAKTRQAGCFVNNRRCASAMVCAAPIKQTAGTANKQSSSSSSTITSPTLSSPLHTPLQQTRRARRGQAHRSCGRLPQPEDLVDPSPRLRRHPLVRFPQLLPRPSNALVCHVDALLGEQRMSMLATVRPRLFYGSQRTRQDQPQQSLEGNAM